MLIRKTRAGASRANLHPIHKSKRNWKEAPWSEIVQHSMIARLQIGQANCCRKLRWQRPWACLEVRIEPPHNLAALKGAFGLENAITKDRFVATHFHLGIGNGGETQIKCPYPRFPWCGLRQWLEPRDRTGALSCDVLLSDLVVLIFVSLHLPWSVDQKCSRVQKSLTNRCGYSHSVSRFDIRTMSAPSIDRIKLYIRHEQCFAFETGFTYSSWNVASEWHHNPPPPPSEERSRCKGVLTMIHSHDLLNLSRTAVCSSTEKISRRVEKPIFPWGVFHLRWLSPHFFSFFSFPSKYSHLYCINRHHLNSQIYWVFEYWKEGWNPYLRELARRKKNKWDKE